MDAANSDLDGSDASQEASKAQPVAKCRPVSVEPIIFLIMAVQGTLVNLRTQYIEARLAKDYNYTLPSPGNCSMNTSTDATGERIDAETALWVMYMKSVSVALPIFSGTILIAASDFVGRRPVLIMNAIGHLVASTIFLLVAWLSLPLTIAVVAECVLGISGDSIVSLNVSYAYVADTRVGKARTVGITLLSFLVYAGFGGSQILVDIILQSTDNFNIAFGVAVACAFLNFVYVIVPGVLLETVPVRSAFSVRATVKKLYRGFVKLLAVTSERRRWRIILVMAALMTFTIINEAIYSVITIYGLEQPFCWSPTLVGIYNVIVNTLPALVALVVIKPLLFCLSGYWIMQAGYLSGIALLIITAVAKTNTMLVYVAVAAGSLRTLPDSLLDDKLSKIVTSNEQGIAFALLSLVLSIGKLISPLLFNAVYAKTVLLGIPQLTFFTAAAIYILPIILTCILQFYSRPFEGTRQLHIQSTEEEKGPLVKEE